MTRFVPLLALLFAACAMPLPADAPADDLGASEEAIRGGIEAGPAFPAVVQIVGCSGVLISSTHVLTAAHCVCDGSEYTPDGATPTYTCDIGRSRVVSFHDAYRVEDHPFTPFDDRVTRSTVNTQGTVVAVHPDYTRGGWLSNDYALIRLNERVERVVRDVAPIPIARPWNVPQPGDWVTLVGFGLTDVDDGDDCDAGTVGTKRATSIQLDHINHYSPPVAGQSLSFADERHGACWGDSGGPALNGNGRIIGIGSTADAHVYSGYDTTAWAWGWLAANACAPFDADYPSWGFCDLLCPCGVGQGDCDSDDDCGAGLTCSRDVGARYGLPSGYDVCERLYSPLPVYRFRG